MDNVNTEQILRYLEGEMTVEERARFEESVAQNPSLAAESQRLSLSIDAMKYMGVVQEVQKTHLQLKQEGSIEGLRTGKLISFRKMGRYGIAAAACILFVLIGIRAWEFYSLNPDTLYSQAWVDYELSASRGAAQEHTEIEQAYQEKNYSKVISLEGQLEGEKEKLTLSDKYYLGLSHMHQKQHATAIPHLREVAASGSELKEDAEFYLALSYLKNKDFDLAISLMEKIKADPSHPYKDRFTDKYVGKIRMLKWK